MYRELPQRKHIRMRGYDYANVGAYFLTICTQDRAHVFGQIVDGEMVQNGMGELAKRCWDAIAEHMPHVEVGEFVVMPNHVHGIVVIRERAVDVRRGAMDRAMGVGARHDAPGIVATTAPDPTAATPDANIPNGIPHAGPHDDHDDHDDDVNARYPHTRTRDDDVADANGQHTRARHDDHDDVANARDPHTWTRDDDHDAVADARDPHTWTRYHNVADAPGPHTRTRHDAPLPNTPHTEPRAKPPGIPSGALGQIVASYKSAVTRIAYRNGLLPHGTPVWQRNYWDRIIRDDGEYERIAKYIRDNPRNWKGDRFNR